MDTPVTSLQQLLDLQLEVMRSSALAFEQSRGRWARLCCEGLRDGLQLWLAQEREFVRRLDAGQQHWGPETGFWGLADEGMRRLNAMADALAADQAAMLDGCQQAGAAWQTAVQAMEGGAPAQPWQEFMSRMMEGLAPAQPRPPVRRSSAHARGNGSAASAGTAAAA